VLASGEPLAKLLTDSTNLNFKVSVPTSYTTVIEAMGSNQVDVGWLAPFAYVLAHDKNGAQVILASLRQGSKTYRSQIIVRADRRTHAGYQHPGRRDERGQTDRPDRSDPERHRLCSTGPRRRADDADQERSAVRPEHARWPGGPALAVWHRWPRGGRRQGLRH